MVNNMKKIWIIYPYGEIIGEKYLEARHIRFGRILAENGYRVVFWTANFSHVFKKRRSESWKRINVCENFDIQLVPTGDYRSNISLKRAGFEMQYARALSYAFKKLKKPDLIITAGTGLLSAFRPVWPYMKESNVPVIYDIMDIHLFEGYMRQHMKPLAPAARLATRALERREAPFYHAVSGVCGLGKNQLEIAVKRTGNPEIPRCLVYNGIDINHFREQMELPLSVELPEKEKDWIWCAYAGSLGPSYDISSLIEAAERIRKEEKKIRFIVAGAGPQEDQLREAAAKNDRLVFLGSVKPEELPAIYRQCDIGLCPYAAYSTVDMPDKFYDYCAAGLAVVNSLSGEISGYIKDRNAGIQYQAENADSLYDAVIRLSDESLLKRCQESAYQLAEQFDLRNLMKPLLAMIHDIIEQKG